MSWSRTSRHARGYGAAWEKVRTQALKRDAYLCQPCRRAGRVCAATQVDHIRPKSDGGTDALSNLQSICERCHRAKTAADSGRQAKPSAACGVDGRPVDPDHPWSRG